ncbi:LysM peptidoglycan-binding domain-containing protein [Gracilimonas mengyeensis]|uniref:Membrane-bound lytic murein transglycosylase D n=1 Tax=Gracilimonas mengyeensis TaxID=1302730 RepID=A0A521EQJ4_9BACT|nr:LysM peptidoglycan-binding domain-containing protein [Gracilimonas mengyeensis]SMO86152.1 membrane-bound lytic murein transglycosylase D [Gracilimonas mengyeensis]
MHHLLPKTAIVLLLCSLFWVPVQAQDTLEVDDMPLRLLDYQNPMQALTEEDDNSEQPAMQELDNFQKDIMSRMSDIYRIHIKAMEAQVNNDPLEAETQINDALSATQGLLDDYPEIRGDRRFTELYRTVVSEYRQFYGISETGNEPQGEIFAIQEELFSEDDSWMKEDYDFPDDLTFNKTDVPLIQNEHVNRHLVYYTLRRPEVMETWLTRAEKYQPMMRRIFREEGAPEELTYLAFIESGLNPNARSWAAAVGMWQFIRATGSVYGLEVNWWVDERRDPEKATRAAARHLRDLYNIWGDWHLAMANYNISPRGLKRAINRAGGVEDYWAAYNYLPRETRGYVPGFIATTMIGMNPEEFGFQKSYPGEPYSYEVVEVDGLMELASLARAAGITTEELKEYNPELLRWATPPGGKYPLKLPVNTKEEFLANYDNIPKEDRTQNITMHTVQSGESLGLIARKYGTTVAGLYGSNENLSSTIYPGQKIVVPLPRGSASKISANQPTNQQRKVTTRRSSNKVSQPANTEAVSYEVKTGDTVGHIAEWYDVRAWNIRTWNGIGNTIRVGQNLTVYVPENRSSHYRKINEMSYAEKQEIERKQRRGENIFIASASTSDDGSYTTYTVKRNDTLSEIADNFGVSLSQIRSLNNISGNRIYVGQTLRISAN